MYGCEIWSLKLREECRLKVSENRLQRRIFGPKRDEITGERRTLHNVVLNELFSSPNVVRWIKSRRMRWAEHVAGLGERRGVYRALVGKPEERDLLEDPSIDGRIMLRWIFRKWDVGIWTGLSWLRIGTGGGHLLMR